MLRDQQLKVLVAQQFVFLQIRIRILVCSLAVLNKDSKHAINANI